MLADLSSGLKVMNVVDLSQNLNVREEKSLFIGKFVGLLIIA